MARPASQRFSQMHDALIATLARRLATEREGWANEEDLREASRLLTGAQPRAPEPKAWLSLHPDGRTIDFNARAARLLGLETQGERLPDIAARLTRAPSGREVLLVETVEPVPGIFQAVRLPDGRTWHLVEAPSPASSWLREVMITAWQLTPGDADIAEALLCGKSSDQIALESGRTIGTVRQAIKGLLGKMAVSSQVQAVARMTALAIAGTALGPETDEQPAWRQTVRPPDGRAALTCWRYGDPGGQPLLFFHGALFGVIGRATTAAEARLFGFDVFAPERPGYGETPLPRGIDPVALAVDQATAILDAQRIGRVQLFAHDVGSVYAFAMARAHPGRIEGIICAPATPPMFGWSQTADMPPLHRVSAFAAQNAPLLMEQLLKLGLRRIMREGLAAIPRLVFADSDHDRETMLRADALPVLEHLHRFALEQDAVGFLQDMQVTNRDWSDWLPGITCPVALLHGSRSRTVSLKALQRMAGLLPDATLHQIPDAGHTMPISHPVHGLRAALRMAR